MSQIHSFPAIENPTARVLVLGSMPGKASLRAHQYYAHPQNAFWRIFGDLIGAGRDLPYETRIEVLRSSGIVLWDVLKSCTRESSLDSDIDDSSIVANDFAAFFETHPAISRVFFNGAKAQACYDRYVLPFLDAKLGVLQYQRLPSTSPAHAAMSYAQKLQAWQAVISGHSQSGG